MACSTRGCGGIGAGATAAGLAGAAATAAAGAFGPVAAAVKAKVNRSVAVINRVKNPIFFITFLLVRIPARTPPVISMPTDPLALVRP